MEKKEVKFNLKNNVYYSEDESLYFYYRHARKNKLLVSSSSWSADLSRAHRMLHPVILKHLATVAASSLNN